MMYYIQQILRPTDVCPVYNAIMEETTAKLYKQINDENKVRDIEKVSE